MVGVPVGPGSNEYQPGRTGSCQGTSVKGYGRIARLALGNLAIAASVAFLVSGCSDMNFPAIHDMPPPRADTTLNPDQVKQATDALIAERDHLSTEAQANGQPSPATNAAGNVTTGSLKKPPAVPVSATVAAPGATQTAGVDTKP